MPSWGELETGPHGAIVRDLRTIIRRGLRKFDARVLKALPQLVGEGEDADTETVRQRLIEFLLWHDPGASRTDPPDKLSTTTNIRLALFRARPEFEYENIEDARERAGAYYRPAGMTHENVRRPGGPEFYAVKELSEEIQTATSSDKSSTTIRRSAEADGRSQSEDDGRPASVSRFHRDPADDFTRGFWWRTTTPKHIEALAGLDNLTIYAGADGPSDVGPPLHEDLYADVLIDAIANERSVRDLVGQLDKDTSIAIVTALAESCPPVFIGSIIRQLHQRRAGASRHTEETLHASIRHQIARSRNTTGFVDRAIDQLAITLRGDGRDVSIITSHLDTDLIDLQASVAEAVGQPDVKLVDYVDADAPVRPPRHEIPVMRIHGSITETCAQPLVLGEADFFNDTPLSGEHQTQHVARPELVANALSRGDVLFVGTSITEPGLISVLAANRDQSGRRYAILVAPDFSAHGITAHDTPDRYAAALALFAQRYVHLGVTPIIVDFDQQVPQLLREVAERVRLGKPDYEPYRDRVQRWWEAVVPLIGLDGEGNRVGSGNRGVHDRWQAQLRTIHAAFDSNLYRVDPETAANERIIVEVWLRNHLSRKLMRFASTARTSGTDALIDIVATGPDRLVPEAFRRGRPVARTLARGRDRYAIAMHLVLRGPSWQHLPVGVVLIKSNRDDAVVAECGDNPDYLLYLEEVINERLHPLLAVPDVVSDEAES